MACSSCSSGNSLSSCGCVDNCPTKTSEFTFDGIFSSIPVPAGSTLNEVLLLMETFVMNSIGDLNFNYELTLGNCLGLSPGTYSYQQMIDAISTYVCALEADITTLQEDVAILQDNNTLVWHNITLVNGWYNDDPVNNPAQYAIQNELMYLKGFIIRDTNPTGNRVFWDTVPMAGITRQIYTCSFDFATPSIMAPLMVQSGEFYYEGNSETAVAMPLDSIPVIRLTN